MIHERPPYVPPTTEPTSTHSRRWQDVVRFADLLLHAAERDPDHEAIVFWGAGRRTYRELEAGAFRVARSLYAMGIRPRSRVGILMPNCPEFVELLFGVSLLGAVMVPINARFAPRELGYVVENGDLEVVFSSDELVEHVDYAARLHAALPSLAALPPSTTVSIQEAPHLRSVVLFGNRDASGMMRAGEFWSLGDGVSDEEVLVCHRRTSIRDVALNMYTSGTTAQPKGCLLSHEALVRTATMAGRTRFQLTPEDRFWDPLPMFHMSAILPIIGLFDAGATFLSMNHFDAPAALQMIEAERATVSYATFPAITQALLNHPDYTPDSWKRVRVINNVAPPDTLREMQSRMPHTLQMSSYGLTECGGVVAFNGPEDTDEQRCTTGGLPFDGIEVEIRDLETGEVLEADRAGEIVVRGYCVCEGYYKDPERTAAVLEPDGWFHTGDVGSLTPEGRIRYLGRTKDMLKVGGENVAALEIESFLGTHPAVSIVAVVGVPDPKYMEVPAAFVELRPGRELREEELLEFARGGLARFKVPRHVRFVSDWPMSATKIQKFRLQQSLTQELAASRGLMSGAPAPFDPGFAERTLGTIVRRQAERLSDRPWLLCDEDSWSFAAADREVDRCAAGLAELGVSSGAAVAVMMSASPRYLFCALALARLGAVFVPINLELSGAALAHPLRASGARWVIVDGPLRERTAHAAALVEPAPRLIDPVEVRAAPPPQPLPASLADTLDPWSIMFTSGTTGAAKGAVMTHQYWWLVPSDLCGPARAVRHDDVFYSSLPMFHAAAWLMEILPALYLGMPVGIDGGFSVTSFLDRVRHYGATQLTTVAATHLWLYQRPARATDRDTPARVWAPVPLPHDLWAPFRERFGLEHVWSTYGGTEFMNVAFTDVRRATASGSAGRARPSVELAVLDDHGLPLAPGEIGELCVRPRLPHAIFQGYVGRPEATLQKFGDLWYHTGDLGRIDAEGEVFFLDRKDDYLRVRGENVSSFEVESALREHPAVIEVAAHGVRLGEAEAVLEDEIKVCVVLESDTALEPVELIEFARERLPRFAVPRHVEFVTELPRSATGRVRKHELRAQGLTPTTWTRSDR